MIMHQASAASHYTAIAKKRKHSSKRKESCCASLDSLRRAEVAFLLLFALQRIAIWIEAF